MDALKVIVSGIFLHGVCIEAVPPQACFENFRWDDCGHPPVPVMYYWKPGSRCEVGMWRGCLPSHNMFKSEYECVSTCIFTVTPRPANWHEIMKGDEVNYYIESDNETSSGDGEGSGSGDEESGSGSGEGSTEDGASGHTNGSIEGNDEGNDNGSQEQNDDNNASLQNDTDQGNPDPSGANASGEAPQPNN